MLSVRVPLPHGPERHILLSSTTIAQRMLCDDVQKEQDEGSLVRYAQPVFMTVDNVEL